MTITQTRRAAVQYLLDVLEDCDYEPRSYSGRGMDGHQCVAVVTGDSESEVVVSALIEAETHHLGRSVLVSMRYILKGTRHDAMGLRTVYYWPEADWPEDTDG